MALSEKIINSKCMGRYQLGWTMEDLKKEIYGDFTEEYLENHYTLTTENLKFWILKEREVISQIMAFGSYSGKFLECIGIGNNMLDLSRIGVRYNKEDYVYTLQDYPGICFELEDIDEWNELIAPIEYISIFNI